MAVDELSRVTRRGKTFYEEIGNEGVPGETGLDDFLFSTLDVDANSSNFALDEFVTTPHGVAFRRPGEQAAVRQYEPGQGMIYQVPLTSEKTPVTEDLRNAVIAGGEVTESFASRQARIFANIIRLHSVAHKTTRWKLSLDVMRTGIYTPLGLDGNSIGLDVDYGRDPTLDVPLDLTVLDMNTALKTLYDAYKALNGDTANMVFLMGSRWLEQFEKDTFVNEQRKATDNNGLLVSERIPKKLKNVNGLYIPDLYRVPGIPFETSILTFAPEADYIPTKGAASVPFLPDNECLLFSLNTPRYKVQRGMDVKSDSGQTMRVAGDVVFDSYSDNDPVQTWVRSNARYTFVPAAVNKSARSIGTFA